MIKTADICGISKEVLEMLSIIYEIYEQELKKKNSKNIFIYGKFINNEQVMLEITNLGINIINNVQDLEENDILIIGPKGIKKEDYEYLKNNNIEFYDKACENFLNLANILQTKLEEEYEIIIIGNTDKEFTSNLNSWINYKGIIINDESDYDNLSNHNKKFIVCIKESEESSKYIASIKEIYETSDIVLYYYSENHNKDILESSKELAENSDIVFIINPSNDSEIYENISHLCECHEISSLKDFCSYILKNELKDAKIGLTATFDVPPKEIYNYECLLKFILFYKEKFQELKQGQDKINTNLNNEEDHEIVSKVIDDFCDLNKDGKYIRGVLIALGEYLANPKQNRYLNLAYAFEIFQTSVLIHDDIIDNARIRRGKETIPRRICQEFLNLKNNENYHKDTLKLANSIGICAGDLGFYEANQLIIKNYNDLPNFANILEFYNDIILKTIKGEIIDVYLPFLGKYDFKNIEEQDILNIYHLKTSWYSIIGPFMLGYLLGNKKLDNKIIKVLNKFGLIFQLKDDILGIFGDAKNIGKSNTSDISEFKQTILYSHIIGTEYKEEFLKIYGESNITKNDLKRVRELLVQSGSYDYALEFLHNLYDEAYLEIDTLKISNKGKEILKGLLIYLNIREK